LEQGFSQIGIGFSQPKIANTLLIHGPSQENCAVPVDLYAWWMSPHCKSKTLEQINSLLETT